MNRWQRFRRLPQAEQGLFLAALFWLPLTSLSLGLVGVRRTVRLLERLGGAGRRAEQDDAAAHALTAARMVRAAARHGLVRATCLPCSLTLWRLLRRRGIPAELRIGTRNGPAGFEAHAWVEAAGLRLDDGEEPGFTPLNSPILSTQATNPAKSR